MAGSRCIVGLEIGSSKTVFAIGEVRPDHEVQVLGIGEARSLGVRKGEIVDAPKVRNSIKEALVQAEELSDRTIDRVLLSVSGGHIESQNNTGNYRLPDQESEIGEKHIEEVFDIAAGITLRDTQYPLHTFDCIHRLDGEEKPIKPIGLVGRTLELDVHVIYGDRNRFTNSYKCASEIPLKVEKVVFSAVASAQRGLVREQKESGVLLIDIGGGTTDFILYAQGYPAASGCIPVGGEHITNDIHLVTGLPLSKAEAVKKAEGYATAEAKHSLGEIRISDGETGYPDVLLSRQELNDIIRSRLEETFKMVRSKIQPEIWKKLGYGIVLTGGTSKLRGIHELAEEVFGVPVKKPALPSLSGNQSHLEAPEYATVLGLIRFAQMWEIEKPPPRYGLMRSLRRLLWPFSS